MERGVSGASPRAHSAPGCCALSHIEANFTPLPAATARNTPHLPPVLVLLQQRFPQIGPIQGTQVPPPLIAHACIGKCKRMALGGTLLHQCGQAARKGMLETLRDEFHPRLLLFNFTDVGMETAGQQHRDKEGSISRHGSGLNNTLNNSVKKTTQGSSNWAGMLKLSAL
eukprot:1157425-Pelagomonas_calceolata.AAC.3